MVRINYTDLKVGDWVLEYGTNMGKFQISNVRHVGFAYIAKMYRTNNDKWSNGGYITMISGISSMRLFKLTEEEVMMHICLEMI